MLRKKDATDYTGLEFYIDTAVKQENIAWFPAMGAGDADGEVESVIGKL